MSRCPIQHQDLNIILELADDPKKITYIVSQKGKQEIEKRYNTRLNRKYPGSDKQQCKNCEQTVQINIYLSETVVPEEFPNELELPIKHRQIERRKQRAQITAPEIKEEPENFEVFAENDSILIYGVKQELMEIPEMETNTVTELPIINTIDELDDFNNDNLGGGNESEEDDDDDESSDESNQIVLKRGKAIDNKKRKTSKTKPQDKKVKIGKGYRYHEFNGKIDIPDGDIIRAKGKTMPQTTEDWENLYASERLLAKRLPYYKIMSLPDGTNLYFLRYNKTGNFYMANFDFRPISCDICNTKTKEIPQLIKHRNLHFFERNSELKCAACFQEFNQYELLLRHVLICREKTRLSGDHCKYCNKKFGSYASLRAHVLIHVPHLLPESRQEKICEICSKTCPDQDRLRAHMRRSHKIDAYCCDHCEKKFAERPELQKHLIRKHFPHLAPLRCSYCNSPFTTECLLKIHVNTVHLNSLDTKCSVCGKKMRPNSIKAHMSKHMKLEERKKYFCHTCGKIFFTAVGLEAHIATLHQDPEQWEFGCETCGKKLPTKFRYKEHVKAHTAPIAVCNICNKTFSSKQYLKDHLNLHSGEKPYHCKVCDKRFADRGCLRNHLKHHEANMGVKLTLNPEERRLQRQGVLTIELPNGLT